MEIQPANPSTVLFTEKNLESHVGVFNGGDLNLRTQEGDLVSLSFSGEFEFSQSESETVEEGIVTQEISTVAQAAAQYSLVVQGNLNEDELTAIQALAEGVRPIAEEFFRTGEFDFDEATETLTASLGQIQEVELRLERVIEATFAFDQTQISETGGQGPDLAALAQQAFNPETFNALNGQEGVLNFPKVRDITELALSVIENEFPAQAIEEFSSKAIARSLGEFLTLLRERLTAALKGEDAPENSNAPEPATTPVIQPTDSVQDFVEV